eukprot:UN18964
MWLKTKALRNAAHHLGYRSMCFTGCVVWRFGVSDHCRKLT